MTTIKLLRLILVVLLLPSVAYGAQVRSQSFSMKTDKVVRIEGTIDNDRLDIVRRAVKRTSHLSGDRLVVIDSTGGEVGASEKIWEILESEKESTGRRIVCVVTGEAFSMAFNLLSRCDVRLGVSDSSYLFHDVYYGTPMFMSWNKVQMHDLAAALDSLMKDNAVYATTNIAALHMDIDQYMDISFAGRTYWKPGTLLTKGYLTAIVKFVE